jgi:hypothetical protein
MTIDGKSSRTAASSLVEMEKHRRRSDTNRRVLDHDHVA